MVFANILAFLQIALSVALIIGILFQQRGTGISSIFGGGGASYHTKRGLEKGLHVAIIIIAILFVLSTIVALIIKQS